MAKKRNLNEMDKQREEMVKRYETASAEGKPLYLDVDEVADISNWYLNHNGKEKALSVTEYGLKLHPDDTMLLTDLAYIYIEGGKWQQAVDIASRIAPQLDTNVRMLQARIANHFGEEEKADRLVDSITNKHDVDTIIEVAIMYMDSGLYEKAGKWLEEGYRLYSNHIELLELYAEYKANCGEYAEAGKLYNQLIDRAPYSSAYWLELARCHHGAGEESSAIEACDYAVTIDEEYGEAYLLRGQIYTAIENHEKAMEDYERAHRYGALNEMSCSIYRVAGLCEQEKWEQALQILSELEQQVDESSGYAPVIYGQLAMCHYQTGHTALTHHYCEKAIRLNADVPELALYNGQVYLEEGEEEKAWHYWEMFIRQMPYSEAMHSIAESCLEIGYYSLAIECYRRMLQQMPEEEAGLRNTMLTVAVCSQERTLLQKSMEYCHIDVHSELAQKLEQLQQMIEVSDGETVLTAIAMLLNDKKE